MSVPREDSDGAVPRAAAPDPPDGVSPEEMESREDLTIEAKEVREAIRFGHADAKERFCEFDERCETAGWGRSIADRLFRALHREDLPQGPSTFLMSLTATVRAFREPTNWRGPARRALERLGSVPKSASILPILDAERDARVRAEEAEEAKARAEAERDEAARAERKILQAVGAVRTLFERARGGDPAKEEEVSDVLRGIGAMRNERDALANAWNAWREAIDAEAAAAGRIEKLEAFRNCMSQSPDAVYLYEARKELFWSQLVSETVKAADAAEVALAKWVARAPAKPVVARHPVPWPPFRFQAIVRERMRTWRIPEFDPDPEAWWLTLLGASLIWFAWAVYSFGYRDNPLARWTLVVLVGGSGAFVLANGLFDLDAGYYNPKPTWRSFRRFLAFCVAGWMLRHWFEWPLFGWAVTAAGVVCLLVELVKGARAGARKRVRRELLDARAKWLSEEIAKRWPDSETEKRWNALTSDLEPLSRQRDACLEPGTGARSLHRWRMLWNRLEALRAWDAVHAQWDVRRQALLGEALDCVRDVRDSVDSVARDAVQLRAMHHERTAAAEEAVEMAVAAAEKSAAAFPAAVASARAAAETAAHGADAARRAWEAAKAATDAAVAKEEEREKRRAEARIEFARLKERTVPAIRARLEQIRLSGDATTDLAGRVGSAESELLAWEVRKNPLPNGIEKDQNFADEMKRRAEALEQEWLKLRYHKADEWFAVAEREFLDNKLDSCIKAADECLALQPGRRDAMDLRNRAAEKVARLEKEIQDWKTDAAERLLTVQRVSNEPSQAVWRKASDSNGRLQSFASWKDHGQAHNEYDLICRQVLILEEIVSVAEAREAFRKRKAEAEESAKAWRVCIPETLYPASARSSDEVWKRADSEAARGATESAKTEYERAARCAEDALRDWKKVVPDAYLAMARAADKPRGSRQLSRWLAQTVQKSSPVSIFQPFKHPEEWEGQFICPWMPGEERSVSLPHPQDVLLAMGNPKDAGEWLADLSRFFEESTGSERRFGPSWDRAVKKHREMLIEDTRKLVAGMTKRQDALLATIREVFNWFDSTMSLRKEAYEMKKEAIAWRNRVSSFSASEDAGDKNLAERIRSQSDQVVSDVEDSRYEDARSRFATLIASQNEVTARESRRDAMKDIERAWRLKVLSEEDRRTLNCRLEDVSRRIGESRWADAQQTAEEIRNDTDSRFKKLASEREQSRIAFFKAWLERNRFVNRKNLEELRKIVRKSPFDDIPGLSEPQLLPVSELGRRCQNHNLVKLLKENDCIKTSHLINTPQAILEAPDQELPNKFQTMNIAHLKWVIGRYCRRDSDLQRFLFRTSAEGGDVMGCRAWAEMQAGE